MEKKFLLIGILAILFLTGAAFGLISSYDSITGFATVNKAISLDIIGSSNDDNYTLTDVEQGETKWSPKIKIKNEADVPINVNLSVVILPQSAGNESDVTTSIWNENKNETLENPIEVSPDDMYFYVKHEFSPSANPGDYFFSVNVAPVD